MKANPNNDEPKRSRREIALGGLAVVASFFVAWNPFKQAEEKKSETVKMLAEDGKLIEVDASAIANSRKVKASDRDLQEWIKK